MSNNEEDMNYAMYMAKLMEDEMYGYGDDAMENALVQLGIPRRFASALWQFIQEYTDSMISDGRPSYPTWMCG